MESNNSSIHMEQETETKSKKSIGFRIFQIMIYLIFFSISLIISYLLNSTIQVIIGLISFFTLRYVFKKTFHCNSTIRCLFYSIIIFIIFAIVCLPIYISILLNIVLGFIITYILYALRDYLDLKETLKKKSNIRIYKGIPEKELLSLLEPVGLEQLYIDILIQFYCKKKNLYYISNNIGYSYQYTYELKSKALNKINNFYKKDT